METYAEWFNSLEVGDPVRVRFPWHDYTHKGGAWCEGVVTKVITQSQMRRPYKTVLVEYDRNYTNEIRAQLFFEGGNGGPFMHLEHPEIMSIHTIDGYKFPSEL